MQHRKPISFGIHVAPTLIALLLLLLTLPSTAFARVDVCYSGGQFLPNFTLNGDGYLNGTDILVTRALSTQRTSVMYDTPLSTLGDIHIRFVIRISQSDPNGGADGMAFVMHNSPSGRNAIGASGEGIGYGTANGVTGISPSVVVEFDTYRNSVQGDTNSNHVAITRGGDPYHGSAANLTLPYIGTPPVTLKSGNNIYVWIDYTASSHNLSVFLGTSDAKPGTATLSTTALDVYNILGNQMYIGFTGSTGGSWNQHEIVALYASDTGNPGEACCTADTDCTGKISPLGPVCDPVKKVCGPCSLISDGDCPQPAGCDVSAALNTCTTVCAGDYNSGATNACLASNFRVCSISGATSGNCVMCNGDNGAGSGISTPCPSGAPTCLDDGFCGRCTSNADCTSGAGHTGTVCNLSTGKCGCASSSDCNSTSAGPVCIGNTYCGCTTDAQCGAGNFCSNAVCKPKLANGVAIPSDGIHNGTCTTNNALNVCTSGECNATTNTCAGPNTSTVCTAANQCVTNVCGLNQRCGITDFTGPCSSGTICQSGICSSGGVCLAANSCWVDADCSASQHCDRVSRGCVNDLASGTALPNDGYHTGSCSDAAAVCASHQCNTVTATCAEPNGMACNSGEECVVNICGSNHFCGIANYDGTCTGANATTLCQSTYCSVGNVCMAASSCYVDADCSAVQYCDRSAHTCRARLVAGGDIPSDGLHNGQCIWASAVCTTGLGCNETTTTCGSENSLSCGDASQCISNICVDGECGYKNGAGTCDASTAALVCQSHTCSQHANKCIPSANGCAHDDDCNVSAYCDGTTFTCQPLLGYGGDLPNDGIHDGTCTSASRVCESGLLCNAVQTTCGRPLNEACSSAAQCAVNLCGSNSLCGYANLEGTCNAGNAAIVCQSGYCGSSSGVCIGAASGCAMDADCGDGNYCNGATHLCVPKLANGTAIPTDGIHDGICAEAATSVVCASGRCNVTTDTCGGPNTTTDCGNANECVSNYCGSNAKCGLFDGQSGCTGATAETVCQSAECSINGTCTPADGCYDDADCSETQYCDRNAFTCRAKLSKGAPLVDDGLHTASCASAEDVCASAKCNDVTVTCGEDNGIDCGNANQCVTNICGTNSKCGLANTQSGCTFADAELLCQSRTCATSGVCIPANTYCFIDSDCAAEKYCDRTSFNCVSDLPVGHLLPIDGLHDGICSENLARAVCLSGLCNTSTNTCAAAKNEACVVAADCTLNTCGSNGSCGRVNGDSCTSGTADECQSGVCGTSSGRCVPATSGCASDADCSENHYCDGNTLTCTGRLPSGSPLPTDPIHDGNCTEELANKVCSSGRCNAAQDSCAEVNGTPCTEQTQCESDACGSNGQCGLAVRETGCTIATQTKDCQSGTCSAAGVCIPPSGCGNSTECPEDQYCDASTLTCTAKLPEGKPIPTGECSDANAKEVCASGVCNAALRTCAVLNNKPCQAAADCVTGVCGDNKLCGIEVGSGPCTSESANVCQSGSCGTISGACVPPQNGCNTDKECASGQYCDSNSHTCRSLVRTGDVIPTDKEHSGECTEATAKLVCESGLCNTKTNTCADANGEKCTSAKDCASNVCGANHVCRAKACTTTHCTDEAGFVGGGGCTVSRQSSSSYRDLLVLMAVVSGSLWLRRKRGLEIKNAS